MRASPRLRLLLLALLLTSLLTRTHAISFLQLFGIGGEEEQAQGERRHTYTSRREGGGRNNRVRLTVTPSHISLASIDLSVRVSACRVRCVYSDVSVSVVTPTAASINAANTNRYFHLPSLLTLHASNLQELMLHSDVSACKTASDVGLLKQKCAHASNREARTFIAVAFTECHIATASHAEIISCQHSRQMEQCVKVKTHADTRPSRR